MWTIVQTRQYITRHSLLSHIDGEIFHGRAEVAEKERVVCMCSLEKYIIREGINLSAKELLFNKFIAIVIKQESGTNSVSD